MTTSATSPSRLNPTASLMLPMPLPLRGAAMQHVPDGEKSRAQPPASDVASSMNASTSADVVAYEVTRRTTGRLSPGGAGQG